MARLCTAFLFLTVSATAAGAQTQEEFFDDGLVHDIRLTLNSRDWETLRARASEDTYYPADLSWRGITVRNIGIRSRGSGTRSGVKPGLRIDMNRYLHDQEFLGLKAFVLDNALTDRTLIHESVAMRLYARMGLVVPREAPARLFVNGEYAGAYVIVEAIDRTFVSRVFGTEEGDVEDGGYLFEYRWVRVYGFEYLGPGLEPYATIFEPHTRETDSLFSLYRPFEQLARAIDESPPERILPDVGRLIGIPELITLVAIQNFLGELDGFVGKWGMANFYLYRFREDRPALVIPWDADHAFSLPTDLSIDYMLDTNVLVGRIMADEGLRRFYLDALLRAAEISAAADAGDSRGWLEREIDRQAALVAPSVAADPVATPEEFEAALTALRTFSRVRPAYVSCAVGLAIDPDQSGRSCIVP